MLANVNDFKKFLCFVLWFIAYWLCILLLLLLIENLVSSFYIPFTDCIAYCFVYLVHLNWELCRGLSYHTYFKSLLGLAYDKL